LAEAPSQRYKIAGGDLSSSEVDNLLECRVCRDVGFLETLQD
jgi:hypothetical protein